MSLLVNVQPVIKGYTSFPISKMFRLICEKKINVTVVSDLKRAMEILADELCYPNELPKQVYSTLFFIKEYGTNFNIFDRTSHQYLL